MCISPNHIWVQRGPKWEQVPAPCKLCWRCKSNRVNDYVARSMAEASVSKHVCTITLTYAPRTDLADKVLHPRHFQLFMKLLRRSGHKVRYLVAGEYGKLKGRAHFHAILFFTHIEPSGDGWKEWFNPDHLAQPDLSPPFSLGIPHKRIAHIREWPHGHVTCDWSASEQSARYVCKYLLSDEKHNAWFSLSKKPALGAAWFARKAALSKEHGVMPYSFEYLPPGGRTDRTYLMTGATRRDYLNAITKDHRRRETMSEWVQKTFDKYDRQRIKDAIEAENLKAALDGSAFLPPVIEPEEPEYEFDPDYVRWWLSQVNAGIDQPFNWAYPHSQWEPPKKRFDHGSLQKRKPLSFRPNGFDFYLD